MSMQVCTCVCIPARSFFNNSFFNHSFFNKLHGQAPESGKWWVSATVSTAPARNQSLLALMGTPVGLQVKTDAAVAAHAAPPTLHLYARCSVATAFC